SGETLDAKLIVGADSRFSTTRRKMGIATSMLDFGRTCIVCTMSVDTSHDDTAVEYFHYDRTLAVLPIGKNQVSVVVTLKTSGSDEVLEMDRNDFSADISKRTDNRFGAMQLTSSLFSYPLVSTLASSFCKTRFALIGDAAVGMHPVTAHGFNLGLQGADTLSRAIRKSISIGEDFANLTTLQSYSNQHRRACLPIYHGTNALVKLFTNSTAPARFARGALLRLGNAVTPARNLIMDRLTELNRLPQDR
ncbi:MAG: FAD-dependent monooxygenase, partial [Paracoccaceae bacterium]